MTTNDPIRPAPLREVLDAGGSPRTLLGEESFAWLVTTLCESITTSPAWWADSARLGDLRIEASCAGEELTVSVVEGGKATFAPMDQATVMVESWRVDVLREPMLLEALFAFATDAEGERWRLMLDCYRRPYPLAAQALEPSPSHDRWLCAGCGSENVPGTPGMRVLGRPSQDGGVHSETPEAGPWCAGCVRDALRKLEALEE